MNELCTECRSRVCEHVCAPLPALTPRHCQILELLSGGLSNKEIASFTGLTLGTVKTYLCRDIFRRLGVSSRFEAALWAVKNAGMLSPDDQLRERAWRNLGLKADNPMRRLLNPVEHAESD